MIFEALRPEQWPLIQSSEACPKPCADTRGILAVEDGHIKAFCVFDSWTRTSVQAHIHIENPMVIRRGFLHEIARYVFKDCDRRVMIGLVPEDFDHALRFNRRIGFEEVCTIPDAYDVGIGYVVMKMTRESCRWLEAPNGRKEQRTAAA